MLELLDVRLKPDAATIRHGFPERKLTVILGGNLAGKTRLARVIVGLEAPDGGELRIGGQPMGGVGPGERPVALVVQQFVNYPNWTVAENLASPLVARGEAAAIIRARVREIARQLEIEALLDRYPASLSGGQQQRLAIGRALAKEAEILVMDEPLVNLDFKLREALQAELKKLQQQLGTTVIYTSTDPRDAFALADEVVLMAGHAFIQSGEPLAVYRQPASPDAADLLSDPRANRLVGEEAVMIRPEHLFLTPGADDDLAFEVRVLAAETNGSETYLHCRPDGALDDRHWVAHLDGLVELTPGQTVTLHAPRKRLIRFAASPGEPGRG